VPSAERVLAGPADNDDYEQLKECADFAVEHWQPDLLIGTGILVSKFCQCLPYACVDLAIFVGPDEVLEPSPPSNVNGSGPPLFFTRVCDIIRLYRQHGVKEPVCQGGGMSQAPRLCQRVLPVRMQWKFICGYLGDRTQLDPHNLREAQNQYFI
jgi:hypothetical protein